MLRIRPAAISVLALTLLLTGLARATSGTPANAAPSVAVPGTAAIFLSNRSDVTIPPLGGDLTGFPLLRNCTTAPCEGYLAETFPLALRVAAGAQISLTVTGSVAYVGDAQLAVGPDGVPGPDAVSDISSLAGISGYRGPQGALVGLFLDSRNPRDTDPPARLDFSSAGLGPGFSSLSPELGQVFFVGDGLTGTGAGDPQRFSAPAGASHLFLGIADGIGFTGAAGGYDDNQGAFDVQVAGVLRPVIFLPLAQSNPVQFKLIEMRRLTPCENRGKHNVFIKIVDAADNPLDGIVLIQSPYGQLGVVLDKQVSGSKGPGLAEFLMWANAEYAVYVSEDEVNPANSDIAQPVHANFTDEEECPEGGGGNTLYHNSFSLVFRKTY